MENRQNFTAGSLFSGIGGVDLGLERAGFEIRWQVELDDYCNKVLAKHWPQVKRYGDIKQIDPSTVEPVDLIAGGFPCQPVSLAGKQQGQDDERWLWPEFYKFICALRPRFVLVENVPGLLVRGFGDVLGNLAASGYDAEWDCIPAAAIGAPHLRYRVYLVAYSRGEQWRLQPIEQPQCQDPAIIKNDGQKESLADTDRQSLAVGQIFGGDAAEELAAIKRSCSEGSGQWAAEPGVGGNSNGIPSWMDGIILNTETHNSIMDYVIQSFKGGQINADAVRKRAEEILQVLRSSVYQEKNERETGRSECIQAQEILQSYMREQQETTKTQNDVPLESETVSEDGVRGLWSNDEPTCTSHRSRYQEQHSGEYSDPVYILSQFLARNSTQAQMGNSGSAAQTSLNVWRGDWEKGIPRVANGIPDRVHRLKALGNAVVPQIVEWLGRRIIKLASSC